MPRRTKQQLADQCGVTINIIENAKNQGVNIWKKEELENWLANRRHRISNNAKLESPNAIEADSIESIEGALRVSTSIDEIKILNEKLKGLTAAQKYRVANDELVPLSKIDERDTRIAAAIKGAMLKISNDLPPMCEGLDATKIQQILKNKIREILDQLSDDQSEFWKNKN